MKKLIVVGFLAYVLFKIYGTYHLVGVVVALVVGLLLYFVLTRVKVKKLEAREKRNRDQRIKNLIASLGSKDAESALAKATAIIRKKNIDELTKLYEEDLI